MDVSYTLEHCGEIKEASDEMVTFIAKEWQSNSDFPALNLRVITVDDLTTFFRDMRVGKL